MKAMHQLIRVPEIQKTMQEMSKEMMKVCTILQGITDNCGILIKSIYTVKSETKIADLKAHTYIN